MSDIRSAVVAAGGRDPSAGRSGQAHKVRHIAQEYRAASGYSFSRGEDADAERFRDAAKALEALANDLPPIPSATR